LVLERDVAPGEIELGLEYDPIIEIAGYVEPYPAKLDPFTVTPDPRWRGGWRWRGGRGWDDDSTGQIRIDIDRREVGLDPATELDLHLTVVAIELEPIRVPDAKTLGVGFGRSGLLCGFVLFLLELPKLLVAFVIDLAFVTQDFDDLLAKALLFGLRPSVRTGEKGHGDQNNAHQR
jgi:hypothetical protein